ncbi:MAG: hypothetical protein PWQ35_256 [Patescibacteria group bacterium]|nr:hypothetical protein [Patescibacteria group bacterium]
MKVPNLIINSLIIAIVILPLFSSPTKAQNVIDPDFNPNNIISDDDILNTDSMTLADIQNFLQKYNSYLANYITVNSNGVMKTAAEIIYDATNRNFDCEGVTLSENPTEEEKRLKCRTIKTISPKFMLVLIQKESSLIEDSNATQSRLDWATGYGCPDNWTCNPYYKGFGKQVNSAALQFLAYMKEPQNYNYKVGHAYTFTNPYGTISQEKITVIPQNQATAALYNYTPHVFNGNYNVYRLFKRYFPEEINTTPSQPKLYPDGSLLKTADNPGIWLIEGGAKRPFLNYTSFISRFSPNQVIITKPEVLAAYPQGENIKFPDYSLVQTPDKTIYLLVGKEKRPFDSLETFKRIGFNTDEIEAASVAELEGYIIGGSITATSTYVTGALLQDITTGGVYYVENGTKAPLLDKAFLNTKYKGEDIIKVNPEILDKYVKVDPILFPDGTLLKSNSYPTVYLISNGKKRAFINEEIFKRLGYNDANIITVSSQVLYQYPLGEVIQ